jgi:hypothetical protein
MRKLLGVLTVLVASVASAAVPFVGTVDFVNFDGSGVIRFRMVGAPNPNLCATVQSGSRADGEIVAASPFVTAEALKAMGSALLAAKLAGKQVEIWVENGRTTAPVTFGCWVIAVTVK